MIKVYLGTGDVVEVASGKGAFYKRTVERKEITETEVVAVELVIRDNVSSYSGKVIASFQADKVLYYTVSEDDEEVEGSE